MNTSLTLKAQEVEKRDETRKGRVIYMSSLMVLKQCGEGEGGKKTEIRDIRNQCKDREKGNEGETEGSMNFNHLKRLREG